MKQILAIDLPNSLKCLVMSLLQRRSRSKHHQDTTAIGNKRMTCLVESLMPLALKLLERRTHVVNTDRRVLENLIDTLNLETLLVRTGITLGRKNETENSIRRPLGKRHRSLVGNSPENLENIGLQTRKDNLGLRIAETAVELDNLDSVRSLHKAAIKHTAERNTF